MRKCWALRWSATQLPGKESTQVDIMQKYVRHQNAYVTTVSLFGSLILPLRALTLKTGKQPGMHLQLHDVTLR